MIPGYPTTGWPGDHEMALLDFTWQDNGTGLGFSGSFTPWTNYGNRFWVVVADGVPQSVVYGAEGQTTAISGTWDTTRTNHQVSIEPIFDWDSITSGIDISVLATQQDYHVLDKGVFVEFDFDAVIEDIKAYGDKGQFSSWNISGLQRWGTVRQVNGEPRTEAALDLTMSSVGAVHTVTLSLNGYAVASGSITGNGTVTLAAQNSSGVSGTVVLAYTQDLSSGATFNARWCQSYVVTCGGVSVTKNDEGLGNRLSATVGPIGPGVQNYSITPTSDTGVAGTAATGTVTVPGRPNAPGIPVYVSGNWTNTVIQWATADPGTGSAPQYNIYDSELNAPTDTNDPSISGIASGSFPGTKTQTLNSLAAAAAGFRRVIVASVLGGVEDGQRKTVKIEYDSSGNVVLPRPNDPTFSLNKVSSGTTVSMNYIYNAQAQEGVATKVLLFLVPEGGTLADNATPDAQQNIATAVNNIARGTINANTAGGVALTAGWYQPCIRTATAAGTRSPAINLGPPIYVSAAAPSAPQNVTPTVQA